MPIVTISDYDNQPFPSRRLSRRFARQCPNIRTCWPGLSKSFNPFTSDSRLMMRRITFLVILAMRLLDSAYFAYLYRKIPFYVAAVGPEHLAMFVVWKLIDVLWFFFVAWNLHIIVEIVGERMVFGVKFGERAFGTFLSLMAGFHLGTVGVEIWTAVGAGPAVWSLMFLAIYLVAWVATWDPEDEEMKLPW